MPTVYQAPHKTKHTTAHHPQKAAGHVHENATSPFTCYAEHPKGVRFETQEEGEDVVLFLRQHPIVNLPWIIIALFLFFSPTLFVPFVLRFFPFSVPIPASYMVIGTAFWYLATFGYILGNFLFWFFNIYIVTNRRVVDIDFHYLLFKEFAEADLGQVQDLSFVTGGVVASFFDYGTVYVQTAAEIPNIEFERVPHPERIIQTIRALIGKK